MKKNVIGVNVFTVFIIVINNMKKYLYEYSVDTFSQNGEDGINQSLFNYLKLDSGVVLEIGAWDGFYLSNTANLWSKNNNYKGILIEGSDRLNVNDLQAKYPNIHCYKSFASIENSLERMVDESKFNVDNNNFILASIDIDGDDLNVTKSLGKYKPIILIVEPNGDVIEKRNPEGSSIEMLVNMGLELGYEFIGMSGYVGRDSGNVYLIRKDFKDLFSVTKLPWIERGVITTGGIPI